MIILTIQQIIFMHAELINQTGGSDGIRDNALLESAIAAPFQEFGGQELFPTIQSKAARLGYGLIKNHAMIVPRLAEIFDISVDELMQIKNSNNSSTPGASIDEVFNLVIKALTVAMGAAVIVLAALEKITLYSGFLLLGIGLACAGVSLLKNGN